MGMLILPGPRRPLNTGAPAACVPDAAWDARALAFIANAADDARALAAILGELAFAAAIAAAAVTVDVATVAGERGYSTLSITAPDPAALPPASFPLTLSAGGSRSFRGVESTLEERGSGTARITAGAWASGASARVAGVEALTASVVSVTQAEAVGGFGDDEARVSAFVGGEMDSAGAEHDFFFSSTAVAAASAVVGAPAVPY